MTEDVSEVLDLQITFKIEIEEGTSYVIKDLGDGNYFTINNAGQVYFKMHNPCVVEK